MEISEKSWEDKHSRLQEAYADAQRKNAMLEERLLTIVEKGESDKLYLSCEMDELNHRLQDALARITSLEESCAKYRSDCLLAVHLLQCQPSQYAVRSLPTDVQHSLHKIDPSSPKPPTAAASRPAVSVSAFPPTAAVFHSPPPPDDRPPRGTTDAAVIEIPPILQNNMRRNPSEKFAEAILSQPAYAHGTRLVARCSGCGHLALTAEAAAQTDPVRERHDSWLVEPAVHQHSPTWSSS